MCEPREVGLRAEHERWLAAFDPQYLVNWKKAFNNDREAAMCEAVVRRFLQRQGVTVEPNEDLTGSQRSPDYRCSQQGRTFYVEVTCLAIDKVTQETGLAYALEGPSGLTPFSPLNDAIFNACKDKASQCGSLSHPALVAVGTFHSWASMTCIDKLFVNMMLTGQTEMDWNVDMESGEQAGDAYQWTRFYSAAFFSPDEMQDFKHARSSISGLLVCGFGIMPPRVLGLLRPKPACLFDPQLLPQVPFGQVEMDPGSGTLRTRRTAASDE